MTKVSKVSKPTHKRTCVTETLGAQIIISPMSFLALHCQPTNLITEKLRTARNTLVVAIHVWQMNFAPIWLHDRNHNFQSWVKFF